MATIPIEIILQDAEVPVDPIPTPEEETNIVVPDTGAEVIGSSNAFSSSSLSSIILPAVLLVLALITICTLSIHRHHKCYKHQANNNNNNNDNNKTTKKEKLITITSTTIAVLSATVLVGNLVIPATKAATNVEPGTAELETADKITIIATREQDGDSDTITATTKNTSYATANLDFGYKVTVSMAEGLTNANLYLDGDETSEYYISPVADGTLADNTWGYTLAEPSEESSYLSIPLSTKPTNIVKEIAKTAEDKPVDIYYTVQIDKDMPNGTYTGELEYTLSPAIEYMQDFSTLTPAEKTATLAYMPESKQYILKDIRDKKPYYISKLADENVWMTQNLDLDLIANNRYTSLDTDLPTGNTWVPDVSTHNTEDITWDYTYTGDFIPQSYDPGDLYWSGVIEAGDLKPSGDDHYHVGNYYDWTAAIATNNSSSYTQDLLDVNQSICPAGWRLPPYSGDKSYENLSSRYINTELAPIYFTYSGIWAGNLSGPSEEAYYWTSVVATTTNNNFAYSIWLPSISYQPIGYYRLPGYSVRCVAR